MGESISLLLMALLSLQSGPVDADGEARATKSASARCAVVVAAPHPRAEAPCVKQVPDRSRLVRAAKPHVRNADNELPKLSASAH